MVKLGMELYYDGGVFVTRDILTGHSTRQWNWPDIILGTHKDPTSKEQLEDIGYVLIAPTQLYKW